MKKIVVLVFICSALVGISAQAQSGGAPTAPQAKENNPAAMLQQTKEKVRPQMVEKTGLTEAQADRVIEILFEMRQAAAGLRDLNEADRSKRLAELKADKDKKFSELLTPEQIASVKAFYEEMGRNAQRSN